MPKSKAERIDNQPMDIKVRKTTEREHRQAAHRRSIAKIQAVTASIKELSNMPYLNNTKTTTKYQNEARKDKGTKKYE